MIGLSRYERTRKPTLRDGTWRYELISNIHKAVNGPKIEADKLTFTFHPNPGPQDV